MSCHLWLGSKQNQNVRNYYVFCVFYFVTQTISGNMHRQKVKKIPIRSDSNLKVREDAQLFKFQILEIE